MRVRKGIRRGGGKVENAGENVDGLERCGDIAMNRNRRDCIDL